jgi:hypothetical protein
MILGVMAVQSLSLILSASRRFNYRIICLYMRFSAVKFRFTIHGFLAGLQLCARWRKIREFPDIINRVSGSNG